MLVNPICRYLSTRYKDTVSHDLSTYLALRERCSMKNSSSDSTPHAECVNTIVALGAHVWRMQVLNQGYFLPLSDAVPATVETLTWPWAHQL